MEVNDEQYLPQDATASILHALKLTQAEQLKALPMLQKDPGATLKEVKEFTEKRHADFTMWVRTFVQTERDYKASQQQYGTRTHAGGALGNELKDKPKKKNDKKRQAGYGGKDQSEDKEKSFGAAGLERKEEWGGPPCQFSRPYTPKCNLCEKTPGRAPGTTHWTDSCPLLSTSQIPKLKTNNVCLGCLRYKGDRPGHRCPPQLTGALFCNVCKTSKKICASPASHASVPIPPTFNGAALGSHSQPAAQSGQTASPRTGPTHGARVSPGRQGTLQEGGAPQETNDDKLNVAILAMHAGTREQPVENKGRLGDPASLTGWVTLKKGADVTMTPCLYDGGS